MEESQSAKTIIITGASTGIGLATAKYFHEQGWNVVATMRKPEEAGELADLDHVLVARLDVTDRGTIEQTIEESIQKFGRIDVVLNNAGYGAVGPLEAATREEVRRQFDVNVFGVIEVMQAILPHFREVGGGMIINIASMGGRITFPYYSLYHGTKWAVEGLTESMQFELRSHNIKLKIVEPGAIQTDFYTRSMNVFSQEGLTAYDDEFNKAMPRMNRAGETGASPLVVAKVIYKAATDGSWKLRYPAAADARMVLLLRRLLPDSLFNWLIRFNVMR